MQTVSQSQGVADTPWLLGGLVRVRRLPPALWPGKQELSQENSIVTIRTGQEST